MKEYKFEQISNTIRHQIGGGFWKPGDRIYSERQLAEIHDVSRLTVKRALSTLVSEGILEYKEGRQGTFVAETSGPEETIEDDEKGVRFIGVAVDNHTPAFASHILQGIHDGLWQNGYHTIFCNTYQENESILEQVRSLIIHTRIRGFIFTPLLGPGSKKANKDILTLLENHSIPCVLVDRYHTEREDHRITLNNRDSFRTLAEYLRDNDFHRILLVNGFESTSSADRVKGVYDVYSSGEEDDLFAMQIDLDERELHLHGTIPQHIIREVERKGPFSALLGLNQQLLDAGKKIMKELNQKALTATIVTSPREEYSDILVVQPITRMGLEAAKLLMRLLDEPDLPTTQLVLKAELLDRRQD